MGLVMLFSLGGGPATGQPSTGPEAVTYRVSFPDARNHYLDVQMVLPTGGRPEVEVFLPVWTPGSYMVREYSRHLEGLQARAGEKVLRFEKTSKNRWRIQCSGQSQVELSYRVYCREMSVRTCWVESDFALLNGAALYLAPVGDLKRPFEVQVDLPGGWKRAETGLEQLSAGRFRASGYDQLVDSPILAGSPEVYEFTHKNVVHRLVNEGEGGIWDGPRSGRDVKKIVSTVESMWPDMPYASYPPHSYTFLNLLTQAGGGLEHRNSCVLMGNRWGQRARKDYLGWLSLVAHEYFHAWNVKTLRPEALGPFDYENENYTPSLWIAEGCTAYYDNLLVRRAGLSTPKEYLEALSKEIEQLQSAPGREVQSLRLSSWDAWIKLYRPDENSPNSSMSYYTKGAIVGFLLDARIREMSGGKHSLDDVFRRAYQLYSGERGYSEAQFRKLAEDQAGGSLASFFEAYVDGTRELDYAPALRYYGLRFKPVEPRKDVDPEAGWLGASLKLIAGRWVVAQVKRQTPAYAAGLNVDDEILAINDYRIPTDKEDRLDERLKQYAPGTRVQILLARREKLMRLEVKLAARPNTSWSLEIDPEKGKEAQARRAAWLGPET